MYILQIIVQLNLDIHYCLATYCQISTISNINYQSLDTLTKKIKLNQIKLGTILYYNFGKVELIVKIKKQRKEYADKKRRAEEKYFKVERKFFCQPHKNKCSTQFFSDTFTTVKINGSQLEIQDKHGQTHKRNSAHAKK